MKQKTQKQSQTAPPVHPAAEPAVAQPAAAVGHTDIPEATLPGQSQKFIKSSRYFTICIYGIIMVALSAIIFKAIIDFEETKQAIANVLGILGPFIFGALIAYVLNPMVHAFYRGIDKLAKRFKIPMKHTVHTVLSILVTYIIVIGFIVWMILFIFPEITKNIIDFVNYIPTAYDSIMEWVKYLQERFPSLNIEALSEPLSDILPNLVKELQNIATNMIPTIYTFSMSIANWIIDLLITIIVSIYMIYDKKRLMHGCWKLIYAFLPQKHIPACQEILSECNRLFSSFVVGKFIDSTIIGVLCFLLMTIFSFPYALLISIIVGVTNMIPYFGPFIGAIPGVIIILFINPLKALGFAFLILCLQQFDGLVLGPKILGDSTGMKPLWIIFAITIGGSIAGVVGMFLGVPVIAIIRYLMNRYLEYRLQKKKIPASLVENALQKMELDD